MQGVYLGKILAILYQAAEVEVAEDQENNHANQVQTQQLTTQRSYDNIQSELTQGLRKEPHGVQQDHEHTQLRRAKDAIGQFELILQVCTYHHIHFHAKVDHKKEQPHPEVHVGRQAHAPEDEELRDAVHVVIDVETVQRT